MIESCNFVTCPLLHSSKVYFCLKKHGGNKQGTLFRVRADKHFSIGIVHTCVSERVRRLSAERENGFNGFKSKDIPCAFFGDLLHAQTARMHVSALLPALSK